MKVKDGYVLREVAGVHFIIPVGEESVNNNRMITVNETGKTIWEALKKDISYDALLKIMLDTYEVGETELRADLDAFLDTLRGARLLEE